jgi:hypothetical protein
MGLTKRSALCLVDTWIFSQLNIVVLPRVREGVAQGSLLFLQLKRRTCHCSSGDTVAGAV